MEITSYYLGVAYGATHTISSVEGRINVGAYAPSFNNPTTYEDTNTAIVNNVTKNNQLIIQDNSTVRVKIPANVGSAKGGATLTKIRATLGGTAKEINYTANAVNIDLGTTNASTNSNLIITLTDSRGNASTWTKAVSVLPYSRPHITPIIARKDGFEDETSITIKGTYSRVNIGGADKNAIQGIQVRLKKTTDANYGETRKPQNISSGGTLLAETYIENLDNTYAWDVEVTTNDSLTTSTKQTFRISEGRPTMFVDYGMKSVGVGRFPDKVKMLQVEGGIETSGVMGVGKMHERGTLDVGGNAYLEGVLFSGGLRITTPTSNTAGNQQNQVMDFFRKDGTRQSGFDISGEDDALRLHQYDKAGTWKSMHYFHPNGRVNFASHLTVHGWITASELWSSSFVKATSYVEGSGFQQRMSDGRAQAIYTTINNGLLWEGSYWIHEGQTLKMPKTIDQAPNGWIIVFQAYANGAPIARDFAYNVIHKTQTNHGFHAVFYSEYGDKTSGRYMYLRNRDTLEGSRSSSIAYASQMVLCRVLEF